MPELTKYKISLAIALWAAILLAAMNYYQYSSHKMEPELDWENYTDVLLMTKYPSVLDYLENVARKDGIVDKAELQAMKKLEDNAKLEKTRERLWYVVDALQNKEKK